MRTDIDKITEIQEAHMTAATRPPYVAGENAVNWDNNAVWIVPKIKSIPQTESQPLRACTTGRTMLTLCNRISGITCVKKGDYLIERADGKGYIALNTRDFFAQYKVVSEQGAAKPTAAQIRSFLAEERMNDALNASSFVPGSSS